MLERAIDPRRIERSIVERQTMRVGVQEFYVWRRCGAFTRQRKKVFALIDPDEIGFGIEARKLYQVRTRPAADIEDALSGPDLQPTPRLRFVFFKERVIAHKIQTVQKLSEQRAIGVTKSGSNIFTHALFVPFAFGARLVFPHSSHPGPVNNHASARPPSRQPAQPLSTTIAGGEGATTHML